MIRKIKSVYVTVKRYNTSIAPSMSCFRQLPGRVVFRTSGSVITTESVEKLNINKRG